MQKFTKNFNTFCYTDMACELYRQKENEHREELLHSTHTEGQISYEKLIVADDDSAALLGKSRGSYYTVHTGSLAALTADGYEDAIRAVSHCIADAMEALLPGRCVGEVGFPDGITTGDTVLDFPGDDAVSHHSTSPEWERGQTLTVTGANRLDNVGDVFDNTHIEAKLSSDMELPPVPCGDGADFGVHAPLSVLCVGLGNPSLTPDALGPTVVSQLVITHHMTRGADGTSLLGDDVNRVSAFVPMVVGQTGIETLSLVRGAVDAVKPDLVLLIDALAASEISTLVRTVQIATTGIHPGGGIGNKREALTRETLGVPVMTVGVPTVIGAATMVYRVLERTGALCAKQIPTKESLIADLRAALDETAGECVAPKDIDEGVRDAARLIAEAINRVTVGRAYTRELRRYR